MKRKYTLQTAGKSCWKNAILLAITALALTASSVFAADTTWTYNGTSSWFVSANWNNGVPDSSTNAFINNGGTAQISADAPMAGALSLTLGLSAGQSGTVQVLPAHGDLSVRGAIFVGKGGTGTLTQTFGTITSATASIASQAGSSGSATVDGTSSTWAVSGNADVGPGGTGSLSVTNGGTVTSGAMSVGGGTATGVGTLTVSGGGTVNATSVSVNTSGTLTGNGTVSVNSGSGTVTVDGTLAPHPGTLTITGSLSFGSGANMSCTVSSTSVDNVQVSGMAALNGKLSVTVNSAGDFTLLHADGGIGTTPFSSYSFTYNGCFSVSSVEYDRTHNNVILHVVTTCN